VACPRLLSLDLSKARLGPAGAVMAAQMLDYAGCRRLENLDLSTQPIGPDGAVVLAQVASRSPRLRTLHLRGCRLGDEGSRALADLLRQLRRGHRLRELDLQNNAIGFVAYEAIEQAGKAQGVQVLLAGNRVLDEALNAVTHGVGFALAILGAVFLGIAVHRKSARHRGAATLYSIALCMLYLASTLYHSFHALGPTVVWIFGIFDHCAIYLLIAGTYCPFMLILFPADPGALRLLVLLWFAALAGMGTTAFYYGMGKYMIQLSLYLGMGWSCAGRIPGIARHLGPKGLRLLVLGGLFYTGGVPFFVRNRRTLSMPDHTLWHIFVLAGSTFHYFCIMWYVVPVNLQDVANCKDHGHLTGRSSS